MACLFNAVGVDALAAPRVIPNPVNSYTMEAAIAKEATPLKAKYEELLYAGYNDADVDDDLDMAGAVGSLQKLQESTGSEILPTNIQSVIDEGCPELFLENQGGNSDIEKRAMSTVTEQLPQAALQAFESRYQQYSGQRVTPEQELELGRIIQAGSKLFQIRNSAEEELGRAITRQEWAERSDLSSKVLRQTVAAYRRAKHILVSANIGLVHAVVNQYPRPGVSKAELVQEGSLGLLRAAELFDPSRGLRFSTYAVVWIKGRLSNSHVKELVRVPIREKSKINKIRQAEQLLSENMEPASIEQIAELSGLTVSEVVNIQRKRRQMHMVSLDAPTKATSRSGTETSFMENAVHDMESTETAERTQIHADLIAAMANNLEPREARLLRLRYGLSDGQPRTLQECAESMGLSYARVYQISQKCLKKLRAAAEAESLQEYLLTIS